MFGTMKSGKSRIQYRNSEATGLGYSLVMQKNEISTWQQVKRSTVESSTTAQQLNHRKIMQSPLLKSKDRAQTLLDYFLFFTMNNRLCLGLMPSKPRGQVLYIQQRQSARDIKAWTQRKDGLQISIIRKMNLPLEHHSTSSRNRTGVLQQIR